MKSLKNQKKLLRFMITFLLALSFVFAVRVDAKAATPAPTGLKQTSSSTSSVGVKWDAIMGSDMYYYWRISETDTFASYRSDWNGNVASSDCTDSISGLSAGKTYYVQVGTSATKNYTKAPDDVTWSPAIKVVTTPESVNANHVQFTDATETSISLTWNAVDGATSYKVEYALDSFDNAAVAYTNTASITLTGLTKNAKYDIKIYSQRQDGTDFIAYEKYASTVWNIPTLPTKITGVDCTYFNPSVKEGRANFEWDRNEVADGYKFEIWKYNGKKKIVSVTTTSYSVYAYKNSKLKDRQIYKIRVCGYVNTSNNEQKYGAWSSYDYFSRCTGSDTKLTKTGSKIKASWKKVKGATSYTVYMSTKTNGKYKKMGTTKKTSYTINKNIKKKTNYYVRIVPNYKKGGKTYTATVNSKSQYSAWCYWYPSGRFCSWSY